MSEPARGRKGAVIVTGAASGIGRAAVTALLTAGRQVLAMDRSEAVLMLGESLGAPARVRSLLLDVTDAEQVERAVADAGAAGPVAGLVNSAGVSMADDRQLESLSLELFDRIHQVNLRGTLLMCRAVVPLLRGAGGGAIVNIGSVAGLRGAGGTAYAVSKAGVIGLSKAISQQYASEGIRCNTICPGLTDTPLLAVARAKGAINTQRPGVVPGMADPAHVGELIAFLLSDSAQYVSGSVYAMDGGLCLH